MAKKHISVILSFWLLFIVAVIPLWAQGKPILPFPLQVPPGFAIDLISSQVRAARFIAVAPNGDVLVAQLASGKVLAVNPSDSPESPPRLVASGLERPNDLVFKGNDLYIAVWTGVVVIRNYPTGITQAEILVNDMPRNRGHNNRAIAVAPDGGIFLSAGSTCNICNESDPRMATIIHYDSAGHGGRIFASGLRNASGLTFDTRGQLWAVVNQRDNIVPDHNNLPPDELDLIKDGGNYGWPSTYPSGGKRLPNPEYPGAASAGFLPATFELQAHSAPLQAVFYNRDTFPAAYQGSLFIAFHGSWNRNQPTGYKVVQVSFADGYPVAVKDFVTGWLNQSGRVLGRPVGLAVGADGSLYISDDTGYLFRVRYTGSK